MRLPTFSAGVLIGALVSFPAAAFWGMPFFGGPMMDMARSMANSMPGFGSNYNGAPYMPLHGGPWMQQGAYPQQHAWPAQAYPQPQQAWSMPQPVAPVTAPVAVSVPASVPEIVAVEPEVPTPAKAVSVIEASVTDMVAAMPPPPPPPPAPAVKTVEEAPVATAEVPVVLTPTVVAEVPAQELAVETNKNDASEETRERLQKVHEQMLRELIQLPR